MQLSIIFGLFILAGSKAINKDNSEVLTKKHPKIIGGEPTNIENIPYQVSIRSRCHEEAAIGLGHKCGGTLISQRAVLTLASCCFDDTGELRPKNYYQLVMGNTYLTTESSTEKKYGVTDLRIHNLYVPGKNDYNIAILFIDGVVPSEIDIRPIGLTKSPVELYTHCYISGWGATSEKIENGHSKSNVLRVATLSIRSSYYCNIPNEIPNQNPYICGKGLDTNYCPADKGGPLVCEDELAGVMLSFPDCGKYNESSIYMNVSFFHDWIKEQNDAFDSKIRTKSITDSSASFVHRWHCFAVLVALLNGFAY